jgi:hypothetical protein
MFPFAFGIAGVTAASEAVRLISTVQGVELDPHEFSATHAFSGFGSEQRYVSRPRCFSWDTANEDSKSNMTAIAT